MFDIAWYFHEWCNFLFNTICSSLQVLFWESIYRGVSTYLSMWRTRWTQSEETQRAAHLEPTLWTALMVATRSLAPACCQCCRKCHYGNTIYIMHTHATLRKWCTQFRTTKQNQWKPIKAERKNVGSWGSESNLWDVGKALLFVEKVPKKAPYVRVMPYHLSVL